MQSLDFSHEEVERAARYHRPHYLAFAAGFGLSVALYSALEWSRIGHGLWRLVDGAGWAGAAAAWAAIVVAASDLLSLPLGFWRGFVREGRWGFSTQTAGGWVLDRAKGLAISLVLAAAAWTAAVALVRAVPGWWPAPAAAAFALLVLLFSFVAPVVLDPIFNRFAPLADEHLAGELRSLAARAGVPVRDVLVTDASRRTTKTNAYVSGLGATRRVVLTDTLLDSSAESEVKLIVAHELGHTRERHVVRATLLGMVSAAAGVLVVWAVVGTRLATGRHLPLVLLVFAALEVVALPAFSALSRRWERVADRCSLELTNDAAAYERAHLELARRNLSDLAPPRLVYAFLFSHPTPPERLAFGRAWRSTAD